MCSLLLQVENCKFRSVNSEQLNTVSELIYSYLQGFICLSSNSKCEYCSEINIAGEQFNICTKNSFNNHLDSQIWHVLYVYYKSYQSIIS